MQSFRVSVIADADALILYGAVATEIVVSGGGSGAENA